MMTPEELQQWEHDENKRLAARVRELENPLINVYKTLRCLNTRNLCGTDTRPVGVPCPCASCVSWEAIGAALAPTQRDA